MQLTAPPPRLALEPTVPPSTKMQMLTMQNFICGILACSSSKAGYSSLSSQLRLSFEQECLDIEIHWTIMMHLINTLPRKGDTKNMATVVSKSRELPSWNLELPTPPRPYIKHRDLRKVGQSTLVGGRFPKQGNLLTRLVGRHKTVDLCPCMLET